MSDKFAKYCATFDAEEVVSFVVSSVAAALAVFINTAELRATSQHVLQQLEKRDCTPEISRTYLQAISALRYQPARPAHPPMLMHLLSATSVAAWSYLTRYIKKGTSLRALN